MRPKKEVIGFLFLLNFAPHKNTLLGRNHFEIVVTTLLGLEDGV